ncbi:SNF2-related [Fusarium pseudocircinatum]|uniref:SNF2-related n=1 Tax=Fusarium pseudocircinatum TaxID=56676 RepID=A0A8H5LG34_9HYPO|nr:SNF2-related [Fusarium pseudocircinatum]
MEDVTNYLSARQGWNIRWASSALTAELRVLFIDFFFCFTLEMQVNSLKRLQISEEEHERKSFSPAPTSITEEEIWANTPVMNICFGCSSLPFYVVQQGQYFALEYYGFAFARLTYVPRKASVLGANSSDARAGSKLPIELNIYGNREDAESIGRTLSKAGTYLQFPRYGLEGVEYYNPHFFRMEGYPGQASIETLVLSPPEVADDRDRAPDQEPQTDNADAVEEILGSLSYHNLRDGIQVDSRIKSALFPYQKEAIDFIVKRETGDIPSELSLWKYNSTDADEPFYQHVFSGAKRPKQEEAEGGILADDMGLGKSLVILSTIAGSLDRAKGFADSNQQSAATLIVVSSTLFTTYATLAADASRGSLSAVHWFRIVLDEAHDIRNRRTNQFKAVAALRAKHRWCLTGTPIQNSMEDLGALVSFLRVPVLENASTFYKFITSPATSSSSRDRFKNLRTLLETICLRRTREILPLQPPVTYVREVLLTDSERQEYNNLIQEGKTQLDMITSGHSKRKVSSIVLQSILKLRLFCNNGRSIDNQQFDVTGLPSDPDEALAYLQQHERNICAICSVTIYSIDNSDKTDGGSIVIGNPPVQPASRMVNPNFQGFGRRRMGKRTRTLAERTKSLKEFQSKTGPTILLMTLGTGAVGLNLAVASRIYLLEPQWNPSIEEQAIGRALRLGQESQVVVVRYITAKTVEQADVVFRQRRKLQLVGGGFGKGKNAASEALVESLLHVFDDDGAST